MADQSLQEFNGENLLRLWSERISACRSSGQRVDEWCRDTESASFAERIADRVIGQKVEKYSAATEKRSKRKHGEGSMWKSFSH